MLEENALDLSGMLARSTDENLVQSSPGDKTGGRATQNLLVLTHLSEPDGFQRSNLLAA